MAGSVLLVLSLWVCIQEWRGNFGSVLWFGWLTVAALALIFTPGSEDRKARHCEARSGVAIQAAVRLSETPGQPERPSGLPRASSSRNDESDGEAQDDAPHPPPCHPALMRHRAFLKRGTAWGAFVLLPCLFLISGWRTEPWPVLRAGAVQGKAGPWAFTLAETEKAAPKVGGSGVPMKAFTLRFADDALPEIRAAYLRARQPRSLRAAGIAFEGNHLCAATIVIPPALQAEEQLWLTVEGRNGEVHHAAVDIARLSPTLVRFLAGEDPALKSAESWEPVLICRNEAAEVVCRGARFGDGSAWGMDGTVIEVGGGNGEPLLSARLNRKGAIRFPRPAGEFHVLMEEGPGQTVELNGQDVLAQRTEDR